ncbi:hypothetical protein SKAU_G00198570 [Synaphobranchus kaupii]|uniref:Uncharacterized protein n=1 Tax=Synaphobranchus kaupii TaxID=118154 RepID=A0A9Q1FEX7_SYNKA|nr:hypothetical protein SKAU_G00198570 [Synaphobranchus kaupii]
MIESDSAEQGTWRSVEWHWVCFYFGAVCVWFLRCGTLGLSAGTCRAACGDGGEQRTDASGNVTLGKEGGEEERTSSSAASQSDTIRGF